MSLAPTPRGSSPPSPLTMYHASSICHMCSGRRVRCLRYQFRECPHACCGRCMRRILARETAIDALGGRYFACPKCARSVHGAGRLRRGWLEWVVESVVGRQESVRERRFCVLTWADVGDMALDVGWMGRAWKVVCRER